MSVKIIDSAASKKRNEHAQKKILLRQTDVQKHFVFPKPETPLLSDKSEFPSLSESLEKASNYLPPSGAPLKYSDKLKSLSSRNQASTCSNIQFKCDSGVPGANQHDNKIFKSKLQENRNKSNDNSKQNVPKQVSDHSFDKPMHLNNKISNIEKKEWTKQKPVLKSKLNMQNTENKSSASSSSNANKSAKSNNQSNKSVTAGNNESKEEKSATTTKKKKRKSKIKRQVALQSGKITFLTPEIHSKILNQASTPNSQNSVKNCVIGNINDEEEYPELGKQVLPVSQKENSLKKSVSSECQTEAGDKSIDSAVEPNVTSENTVEESPVIVIPEKAAAEKKVHSQNPITVSFYDMLLEKNVKQKKEVKELKMNVETPNVVGLSKLKNKMNAKHPHNLLDSSSPAIKRGKEREKPKPKKPSQLKKIILLDRKARREYLLQMKHSNESEKITNDCELLSVSNKEENNHVTAEIEDQYENNPMNNLLELCEEDEENEEAVLQLNETTLSSIPDELISEMALLTIFDEIDSYNMLSDLSSDTEKIAEKSNFPEKVVSDLSLNENIDSDAKEANSLSLQINNQSNADTEIHLKIPQPSESCLNSLIPDVKFNYYDKERAVKILLHTRNFREYCNHLISKDIDDATYALLDDLARFQDRLHQKDPVKARMKKRMIYGVKEVKKHIKLRKLKCIIIAVDIENVETQGGLNDILNEIKTSAVDHHIPCIFALSRKFLGKVCRKPVPVSCVGVFNYEGSEVNFRKVVELQSQSKADYSEIFNKLLEKITDEDVATLIKAKKEAPETLREVRTNILSNFFMLPDSVENRDEDVDLKSSEDMSDLLDECT